MTRRVLIIDDDDAIREVAEISLAAVAGYDVTQADSGAAGVIAAQAAPPDAVLLDVMMPGMDGPATLEQLLAHPATQDVPVVFLTAKVLPSEVERLERLGARGVIAKPFDPVMLAGQLAGMLGW